MPLNLVDVFTAHHGARETGANDSWVRQERRKRARTLVHWPLLLRTEGSSKATETVTQNLSSSGFYCFSPTPFKPGETLLCTLQVPAYGSGRDERTMSLECSALVMRAEAAAGGSFGIACRIEHYCVAGHSGKAS